MKRSIFLLLTALFFAQFLHAQEPVFSRWSGGFAVGSQVGWLSGNKLLSQSESYGGSVIESRRAIRPGIAGQAWGTMMLTQAFGFRLSATYARTIEDIEYTYELTHLMDGPRIRPFENGSTDLEFLAQRIFFSLGSEIRLGKAKRFYVHGGVDAALMLSTEPSGTNTYTFETGPDADYNTRSVTQDLMGSSDSDLQGGVFLSPGVRIPVGSSMLVAELQVRSRFMKTVEGFRLRNVGLMLGYEFN